MGRKETPALSSGRKSNRVKLTTITPLISDIPDWMNAMLEASSDAFFLFNDSGVLEHANQKAVALLDLPSTVLIGKKFADIFGSDIPGSILKRSGYSNARAARNRETQIRISDGKTVIVHYSSGSLGEGKGFWALVRDLTENRRLQEERMKFAALMEERSFAKAAERRAEFLSEASAVLSSTLDPQTALLKFAKLAVPHFADWCTVFVREGNDISPMVIEHSDSKKIEIAREMHRRFPLDPARKKEAVSSVITEKSILMEKITESFLKQYAVDPEQLEFYKKLKIRSYISTPLIARGKVIGAISYATAESKRYYNAADLAFSEELARRASFVMDNMTLYAEAKKAEEELKASLAEKEVLLQEVHHRVKNNLQVISSLLNIQARHIQDPAILRVFEESKNRIRAMALIHEKMHGAHNDGQLLFHEYLRSLITSLFRTYSPSGKTIELKLDMENLLLDIGKAVPLGLITNELVSNSLKYAFNDSEQGCLRVVLKKLEAQILLQISDDGTGLPKDVDFRATESLGLKLTNLLVRQLNGTIELLPHPGTGFEITFPV